jgi:hypothetical protein
MEGVPARKCAVLIDEFDFSTDLMGGSMSCPVEMIETPRLQQDAVAKAPLLAGDATLEISGYYSGYSAGDIHKELTTRQLANTLQYAAVIYDTRTLGGAAHVLVSSWNQSLKVNLPVKELITIEGAITANPLRNGIVVANGTLTAGAQTIVDNGAAGAGGLTAFLFVQAINGTPTTGISVALQGSTASNFATSVTLGTWADFSAVGCKVLTVASGTVQRYLRLNVDLDGATNVVVKAIVCVPGVNET